jgi:hypothetical protein
MTKMIFVAVASVAVASVSSGEKANYYQQLKVKVQNCNSKFDVVPTISKITQ